MNIIFCYLQMQYLEKQSPTQRDERGVAPADC